MKFDLSIRVYLPPSTPGNRWTRNDWKTPKSTIKSLENFLYSILTFLYAKESSWTMNEQNPASPSEQFTCSLNYLSTSDSHHLPFLLHHTGNEKKKLQLLPNVIKKSFNEEEWRPNDNVQWKKNWVNNRWYKSRLILIQS